MTERELKVYAVGHYSMIALAFAFAAVICFQVVNNELHPANLIPACPVPKEGK